MSQVSLRIKKLKCSNISGAKKHNQREYKPDNAHTEKSVLNEVLIDSGNIDDLVFSRIRDQKALVIESGKNASTIAIEMVLSASPEYFRDDPLDTGVFDQKKMEVWRDANLVFLKNKYGDNLVRVDLHLDESTPHMHAIITPLVQKERKIRGKDKYRTVNVLDAKNMFNRKALVELQSEAAEAVSSLGIQRGLRHSKATHTPIRQNYTVMSKAENKRLERHVEADEIGLIGGHSKETLRKYANYVIDNYEEHRSKQDQRIKELEIQLETKSKQLEFYAKYQDHTLEGGAFMQNVRYEVESIHRRFKNYYHLLQKQNDALLEINESLQIEKQNALRELDISKGHYQDSYRIDREQIDSHRIDREKIKEVYTELSKTDLLDINPYD